MTIWVKKFVNEAIMRKELKLYGAMYRLSDGKYYKVIVTGYSQSEVERKLKKNFSDASWHEFQPTDREAELIESYDYLYVWYMRKARDL